MNEAAALPAPRTVITSICMNRNAFLRVSVPHWIRLGLPIVIVDWSSSEPVRETLRDYLDAVTIVEVPGKRVFNLAKSKNVCWRAARKLYPETEYLLNFDCDVYVPEPERFFRKYPLFQDVFYSGGVDGRRTDLSKFSGAELQAQKEAVRNRWATYGTFLAPMALLEAVNMNDERMEGYGMFDLDLYQRMRAAQGKWRQIRFSDLFHQYHVDRTSNYDEKDLDASMAVNTRLMKNPVRWSKRFVPELQSVVIDGVHRIL